FDTYYFMYVLQSYQYYHKTIIKAAKATFSISKLNLYDSEFENFQSDLNCLINKYYNEKQNTNNKERTISLVIIP
ncbi:transcriptional regulator, partial [Staphylococcus epidermidis]